MEAPASDTSLLAQIAVGSVALVAIINVPKVAISTWAACEGVLKARVERKKLEIELRQLEEASRQGRIVLPNEEEIREYGKRVEALELGHRKQLRYPAGSLLMLVTLFVGGFVVAQRNRKWEESLARASTLADRLEERDDQLERAQASLEDSWQRVASLEQQSRDLQAALAAHETQRVHVVGFVDMGMSHASVGRGDAEVASDDWTQVTMHYELRIGEGGHTVEASIRYEVNEGTSDKRFGDTKIVNERSSFEVYRLPNDDYVITRILSPTEGSNPGEWFRGRVHDFVRYPDVGALQNIRLRFDGPGGDDGSIQAMQGVFDLELEVSKRR